MPEAPESTRVIFTFDQDSLDTLKNMQKKLGFKSLAETVRESLRLANSLQDQAEKGFSEMILRNPKTEGNGFWLLTFWRNLRQNRIIPAIPS